MHNLLRIWHFVIRCKKAKNILIKIIFRILSKQQQKKKEEKIYHIMSSTNITSGIFFGEDVEKTVNYICLKLLLLLPLLETIINRYS